jgi:hypothetical protein
MITKSQNLTHEDGREGHNHAKRYHHNPTLSILRQDRNNQEKEDPHPQIPRQHLKIEMG